MTKEEMLEDIGIGDVVKIYTGSDETFEGEVIDFGESGLKIRLLDSSKSKRIMYERVNEYEVESAADRMDGPIAIRRALFLNADKEEDVSEIRKELENKIDSNYRGDAARTLDMTEYAKKVHEFALENDRVKRIIAQYKQDSVNDKGFLALLGLVYQELGEYDKAIECYHDGGAYDREFILSYKRNPNRDYFNLAVVSIEYCGECELIMRWLCEYAVKKNNYPVILFVLAHSDKLLGDIMLYWYADKREMSELPNANELHSQENIEYLKRQIDKGGARDEEVQKIISCAIESEIDRRKKEEKTKEKTRDNVDTTTTGSYRGVIFFYNKKRGFGKIKCLNGDHVFFHITQVKDQGLQKILETQSQFRRRVTFTKGININGDVAADAIELDKEFENNSLVSEYDYEGVLSYYNVDKEYGTIRSGNNYFHFAFNHLKDPLLRAELLSNPNQILNLVVRFDTKEHYSKNTNRKTRVAIDIVGKKEYARQEIDDFINRGYVTSWAVDEWLNGPNAVDADYFTPIPYEPLVPISSVKNRSSNSRKQGDSFSSGLSTHDEKEGEKAAIAMVLPQDSVNPYLTMPKDTSGKRYYTEAFRYWKGYKTSNGEKVTDLEKAEELFIKAIQSMEQVGSSVTNLVNIYTQKGGDYIAKGLQLLEAYGYLFPSEKLTNLRIQLIDKSGNKDALEQILLSAIPNCEKVNTVWQYTAKLASIYYKQQKWNLACVWFEKSLNYLDEHQDDFPRYQALRNGNLRSLIMAKYNDGDKEYAIERAQLLLETMPNDWIVQSIISGTFTVDAAQSVIDDFTVIDLQYEDELLPEKGEFSAYIEAKLQEVDLSSTFNKVNAVYSKIRNGRFAGKSSDVERALNFILSSVLEKGKTVNAEYRSIIYIGIARMILDSRSNKNAPEDTKVSIDEVKKYVGRYARYAADVRVEKYATLDSIRYMYILALRYLVSRDSGEISAATNMLVASFFAEGRALIDALHDLKPSEYNEAYYNQECISAKDFLIATFMLRDKQEYVNNILANIFEKHRLREKCITAISKICHQDMEIATPFDFEGAWKMAKSIYENTVEQIGKEISETVDEYLMVESIRQHADRIEELLASKVLWNQDESVLKSYMEILSTLGNTFEKYTVKEKIDGFRLVEVTIRKLKRDIEDSPTELSYDYVYTHLDALSYAVRGRFDELYQSSRPECGIYLSNNAVYVNESKAEIAITFRNATDKQDADAVEIDLAGSEGATFIRCDKKFTSIKSGEAQDYLAVFSIDDKVMADGQFDISINLKYQYRDAVEKIAAFSTMEVLPVNISDKENFVPIPNKYDRIFRGSSVDVKTPDLFKGRNELIDSICASMSSDGIMLKNRGIILWGQRRVGKNSVKDYLKERIHKEYPNAYIIIELGSIGKCRNLREVLITIINQTEDALMQPEYENLYNQLIDSGMVFDGYALEKTENYMPEFNRFMDRLSKRLKRFGDSEQNIPLYFIDEFSYLYEWIEKGEIDGKEFMRFWKSFIQDYGICAIIIAQDNIPVWKSRYENEFACMNHDNEITFLDFDGANALICEPCQIDGKSLFTPEAVDMIYNWTKGSAYLIVIFCKYIIDYLNENYMEKATKTIVQIVFEKEFLDKKGMFLSEDFEPQIQDVANVGHEGEVINRLNEMLLKEIAIATISSSQTRIDELAFFNESKDRELTQKVFDRLRDRKIIEVERDTYCSISMPLLKFYLLREQALLNRDILNKLVR
ncbi:MAG: hypothetical protein J5767_15345 [Paludibacteraceae bacterium]|nr:hypothetical protein [Paludibacteraceae bacterium]